MGEKKRRVSQLDDIIHEGDNIVITPTTIQAGTTVFAVESVQSVSIAKSGAWTGLGMVLGLLAMAFGGTMMSCFGILVGALQATRADGDSMEGWTTQAWLLIAGGLILLFAAKHIPPFNHTVVATIGGAQQGIYRTRDPAEARAIMAAILRARAL